MIWESDLGEGTGRVIWESELGELSRSVIRERELGARPPCAGAAEPGAFTAGPCAVPFLGPLGLFACS